MALPHAKILILTMHSTHEYVLQALAGLKNKLPNTAGRISDVAGGVAYVDGDLNIGVSYAHHDARYGVPIRFSLDPDEQADWLNLWREVGQLLARVNQR